RFVARAQDRLAHRRAVTPRRKPDCCAAAFPAGARAVFSERFRHVPATGWPSGTAFAGPLLTPWRTPMMRLTIETLEGRDLLSADVLAGSIPTSSGPRTAAVTRPDEPAGAAVSLTASLGSTNGSVVLAAGFTPPIGSNKGSLVAGDADD